MPVTASQICSGTAPVKKGETFRAANWRRSATDRNPVQSARAPPHLPKRAPPGSGWALPKGDGMLFERSTGRRFRLRATLVVMGLVGSSLALSLPARAEFAQPDDDDPTELYVPKAGYVYNAPRPAGRLTPATG